jgi:hypothetical protein
MADGSRHRRWLPGLVKARTHHGSEAQGLDSGDPLVAYYRDLRHLADKDTRTRRSLAP